MIAGATGIAGKKGSVSAALVAVCAVFLCIAAADGAWLKDVPDADRQRVNPFAGQKDAIAAGNRIFLDRCAKCHGDDGTGRKKKPSLRTDRVQRATDGEIFWLLKNGSLKHGMPSWSAMPEPMRWQVVTFVKSMGTSLFGRTNFGGGSEESGR
ncbi:MAG TPA: c-type cytochrome [Candidatus Acidoferrum sp.]|jgi:mono/diheme cytochrome c family protein|nr:c-type cytochrome [Candidatus Acidoferrum sp.]